MFNPSCDRSTSPLEYIQVLFRCVACLWSAFFENTLETKSSQLGLNLRYAAPDIADSGGLRSTLQRCFHQITTKCAGRNNEVMSSRFIFSAFVSQALIVPLLLLLLTELLLETRRDWTRLSNQLAMCLKAKSIWGVADMVLIWLLSFFL